MFVFIVFDLLAEPCDDFLHFLSHLFEECDGFAEGGRVFLFQFLHLFAEHVGIAQVFKKILLFGLRFNYILFHVVFVLCSQSQMAGSVGLIFTFYLHRDFDLVATSEVAVMADVSKDELSENFLTVIVTDCTHLDVFSSERASVIKTLVVIL